MFNQTNIENRSRHLVRGRVLVFTDSHKVELLLPNLTVSYPLFSYLDGYPPGHALVFSIEAHGWLTFDANAQVKITEMSGYHSFWFDPKASSVVSPADAIVYRIFDYNPVNFSSEAIPSLLEFDIYYGGDDPNVFQTQRFHALTPIPGPYENWTSVLSVAFQLGSVYRGILGYPAYSAV